MKALGSEPLELLQPRNEKHKTTCHSGTVFRRSADLCRIPRASSRGIQASCSSVLPQPSTDSSAVGTAQLPVAPVTHSALDPRQVLQMTKAKALNAGLLYAALSATDRAALPCNSATGRQGTGKLSQCCAAQDHGGFGTKLCVTNWCYSAFIASEQTHISKTQEKAFTNYFSSC